MEGIKRASMENKLPRFILDDCKGWRGKGGPNKKKINSEIIKHELRH